VKLWRKFKDWYLGGDPKCDGHEMFISVGWGLIPLPGERGRLQAASRRIDEKMAHRYSEGDVVTLPDTWQTAELIHDAMDSADATYHDRERGIVDTISTELAAALLAAGWTPPTSASAKEES
jgi:hypothetical protein